MIYYLIVHDTCELVEGSCEHTDFSTAWAQACALAKTLGETLYITSSNGKQSWQVTPQGEIAQLPNEPEAYLLSALKTMNGEEN